MEFSIVMVYQLMWSLLGICGISFAYSGLKLFGKQKLKLIDEKKASKIDKLLGENGVQVSKDIILTEKASYEGICVFGPTGSFKTTTLIIPNLLQNKFPKSSIVVLDLKGEIQKITGAYQKTLGRKIYTFSPLSLVHKFRYNILEMCVGEDNKPDVTQVRQLAQSIVINGSLALSDGSGSGSNSWENMSIPLTTSALLWVMQFPTMNNVTDALKLIINSTFEELDDLFSKAKDKNITLQWNLFKTSIDSPKTMGSIKITLATSLQIFTDPKIEKSTCHSDFNFKNFRKEPSIIYIQYDQQDSKYLAPFMAVFYTQMFKKLLEKYNDKMLPTFVFLDEFNNAGKIIDFDNICATARSSKLSIMPILQDLSGLQKNYGENCGATILNNLKTKLVLGGLSDLKAQQYISTECGPHEVISISESKNSKGEKSKSTSAHKEDLLSPADIRKIGDEDILIIISNKQAIIRKKNTYFKQEKYTKNVF